MNAGQDQPQLRLGEFVALMALLISLTALSIDAILPALPDIGRELDVGRVNDTQLVVSAVFFGMASGQVLYGPISDSIGRKRAMYLALLLYIFGTILSLNAASFPAMLVGRFIQGIGAAGPRIVTVALVRDQHKGAAMARIMSFVMAVFIIVPVIAPAIGQGILLVANWRAIFWLFLILAIIAATWFAVRQPETLPVSRRVPFSLTRIGLAVRETCANRVSLGYTVTAGLIFGAFIGYLISAQQILQQQYALGVQFPIYFGVLSIALGTASVVNAKLVLRFGMRLLSRRALIVLTVLSVLFYVFSLTTAGQPPLWALIAFLLIVFFCLGILFGNFNAMAMEPLGHIAGVGASVVGSLTTFISLFSATIIGHSYDGTVLPLIAGFALLGLAALVCMHWVERGRPAEELG